MNRTKKVTFTSSGSWTCPAGVTSVILFGRGGSAAGGSGDPDYYGTAKGCAMGGGGCYSTMHIVTVVPNTTYTVTIGAGGTASSNQQGGSGGDTTFGALATFKGAVTSQYASQGLTMGGTLIDTMHQYIGGQRSPFATGGTGEANTIAYGGGGGGDGAGGNANKSGTGVAGTNGGGGGAGSTLGGAGSAGKLVVMWNE